MASESTRQRKQHAWIWYYRATSGYIAVMVTVVVLLLLKGYA